MKILQSKSGKYYEFEPSASPVSEDAYWLCFVGRSLSDTMSVLVIIYFIRTELEQIAERLLAWLKNIPKSVLNHPNIICPIDYVEETNHASQLRGTDKRLYIIGSAYDGVSMSELMQGQTNGKSLEFATPMYELYKNDRIRFAKTVTIETLKILEHLHNLGISIGCIDPVFILLIDNNKLKINFIETFHWYQVKQLIYNQRINPKGILISLYGAISGKYNDMVAPELLYGYTDARIDLYSTGIMLFYLITGHLPFHRNIDMMISFNQDVPLHEIEDKQLRWIIKKATEKDPAKRFQSASEFVNAFGDSMNVRVLWYKKIISSFLIKKNRLTCILLSALCSIFFCPTSDAQNTMCINYKDGCVYEVPIERIDSITFIDNNDEPHDATLIGDWLWGNKGKGYYELLTFNEDRTYIGYDYYLEYGFDTWTYGTYMVNGIMLNLWSNGYGYHRTYRWFVSALTENALEVMTQMGSFTYYRVQPEIYSLKVGEESYECTGDDYYIFTDGGKVSDNEGKLKGVAEGVSYILKYDAKSGLIMAYKVTVEK